MHFAHVTKLKLGFRIQAHLDKGHVLLRDGAVARVEVGLVEEEVVDVESPRETDLVILQTWTNVK